MKTTTILHFIPSTINSAIRMGITVSAFCGLLALNPSSRAAVICDGSPVPATLTASQSILEESGGVTLLHGVIWSKLADIVARATNRTETVIDTESATNRFYRLVTPRQP